MPTGALKPRAASVLALLWALAGPGCQASTGGSDSDLTTEDCAGACSRIAAADCGDVGSGCFNACVTHPNAAHQGSCATELKAYVDCFWRAGSFRCDAESKTIPVACDAQLATYEACHASSESGGAGGMSGAAGAGGAADAEP